METIYEARAGVNGVNRCVSANSAAGGARRGVDVCQNAQEAKLEIPVHSAGNTIFMVTPARKTPGFMKDRWRFP